MLERNKTVSSFIITTAVALAIGLPLPAVSHVQTNDVGYSTIWDEFSAFDENSDVVVDHQPLTDFLQATVFPVGRSKARLGQAQTETYRESHIKYGNGKPSRYEGNRLFIHAFTDDHYAFLEAYKDGLERLSDRRPLAELSRDEQLAYWFNLYNVIVMKKLIEEYPIQSLKSLRLGSASFWDENTATVQGVPLSLRDIETIVYKTWQNPLVMYGFFQGTIGGPSLPTKAFTAENVWGLLEQNAVEYINSNRGVRPRGSKAKVSIMYEWGGASYGYSEEALLEHINHYADTAFLGDISNLQSLQFKYYDWTIADMLGGVLHSGRDNNLGGVLTARDTRTKSEGHTDIAGLVDRFLKYEPTGPQNIFPPLLVKFVSDIMVHNDLPDRTPVVTVIECDPGQCEEQEQDKNNQEE